MSVVVALILGFVGICAVSAIGCVACTLFVVGSSVQRQQSTDAHPTTPASASPVATTGAKTLNPASAQLSALSDEARNAVFTKALRSEGCDVVTRSCDQGTDARDHSEFWDFGCRNGKSFSIQVFADANGSRRILECGVLKLIGTPCFVRFEDMKKKRKTR
jgi:hypothetical protein